MKKIQKKNKGYQIVQMIVLLFSMFLSACGGVTPTAPVIQSFTTDATPIEQGESTTLSWQTTGATTITIDQGIGTVTAPSGSVTVSPLVSTTYTLTAANSDGTATAELRIVVTRNVNFESLITGNRYYVGDVFVESGVTMTVLPFQWDNGSWTYDGYAEVVCLGLAGDFGNEINLNNVNLGFHFGQSIGFAWLLFGEYGGNLNLEFNGEFKNFDNFADIDASSIGGVDIIAINGDGNDKGIFKMSGEMAAFAFQEKDFHFILGGQELWIDQVEAIY